MANLLNLERVSKAYGVRPLLADVSLGIGEGERIGVVGRNGDGKTTLLEVMTGQEPADSGRVSRSRGLLVGFLHQHDALVDTHSVREAVLAGRADHEWAADPRTREIVEELLAGVTLDRAVLGLSRRRAPSLRAGRAAARRPRPDRARRADQPPRRGGGRLAGPAPRRPPVRARGRHPRPLVPRRRLPVDVGGARRPGGRLRGRLRGVRAGQGRAQPSVRGHRGASAEPGAQGARLAAPRPAGADLQAEVPHRRGQPAHRGRPAAAGPLRAAAVRDPAARQGRRRRRGRRPGARRPHPAAPRHLAARSRRPGRHRRRERRRQDLGPRAARRLDRRRRPGAYVTAAPSPSST